jgi:hypothetical protein
MIAILGLALLGALVIIWVGVVAAVLEIRDEWRNRPGRNDTWDGWTCGRCGHQGSKCVCYGRKG